MKKETFTQLLLIAIFFIFSYIYYTFPLVLPEIDKVYITITTFFFSIFTGFFISQQVARYSKLREVISTFDGRMSSIYRSAGNISKELQEHVGDIITKHYKALLTTQEWEYHFTHKSETLQSIHALLEKEAVSTDITPIKNHSVGRIVNNLSDCEVARKTMILLYEERIPQFQWFVIMFFIMVLLTAVSAIPSHGMFLESILKSAFAVSIFSIGSILYHLDMLHLFENFIGENSARDVIGIIKK